MYSSRKSFSDGIPKQILARKHLHRIQPAFHHEYLIHDDASPPIRAQNRKECNSWWTWGEVWAKMRWVQMSVRVINCISFHYAIYANYWNFRKVMHYLVSLYRHLSYPDCRRLRNIWRTCILRRPIADMRLKGKRSLQLTKINLTA